MADPTVAEKVEEWSQVGEQFASGIATYVARSDLAKVVATIVADVVGTLVATGVTLMSPIGIGLAKGIAQSEDIVAGSLSEMAAAGVNDMFNVNVPASAFEGGIRHGKRQPAADALANGLLKQLAGAATDLEPSDEAATRYLGVMVNMALEGWYQKWFFEFITSLIPQLDIGKIENFGSLDDKMAQALGLGRLTRRVLSPIVDDSIVTPLKWQTSKTYRPQLLSPASVVRQFLRGKWDWEDVHEELARQGYSEARIDALLNEQRKFLSVADVRQLEQWGQWTHDQALQHLREQGYDLDAAELALRVEGSKRIEQLANTEASALTAALVDGRIDQATFDRLLTTAVPSAPERAFVSELAALRVAVNVQRLSSSEVAAAIELGVLAFPDYRAALRRESYAEDAIDVKDLMLRTRLDKEKKIEQHRAEIAAERAAEKAARDKAAAEKRAQLAADQARARRGKPSDLERAVVRGLVSIGRYLEVLTPIYDADTVEILRQAVEADRAEYVDQQQRAEDARKRAERQGLNVGQLEQAVLHRILTVDQYRQQLAFLKFAPADADVLTRTLAAKLADQTTAARKRAEAEEAAKRKSVNLTVLEQLVRRGLRSMASYDAFLASLGYDEADRADLEDLLKAKIADDRAAADARAAARDQLGPGGLTIDQFRRSVLLGLRTEAQFDTFLTALGLSADVHGLLMAELRDDLAQTNAARQRRAQGDSRPDARDLPLATVQRAARLGIIAVDTYQQRLVRAGYSDDDIGIETELLLLEIADVQAARQQQAAVDQAAPASGLSLAEIARAVKAGALTLDDYRARAVELGVSQADVDTLTRVLGDDLAETRAAQARRTELDSTLKAQNVSLAVLEDQVRSGTLTLDGYFDTLVRAGLAPEDADVLWSLLADDLGAPIAAGSAA